MICKRYFEEHHDKRQIGQLNERIIQLETNDIIRLETNSNINIIQATKLKKLSYILLDYLHAFGILRESDGEKKFRHRDFAVIAYVEGSPMKLGNLDKEDTIFSYIFPHPQYHAKVRHVKTLRELKISREEPGMLLRKLSPSGHYQKYRPICIR